MPNFYYDEDLNELAIYISPISISIPKELAIELKDFIDKEVDTE